MRHVQRTALVLWMGIAATGCAGNRLKEFDYRGRTLGVVSEIPYRPDVLTGSLFDVRTSGDPIRDVLRVGARVAREVSAADLQARLDSASTQVDVGYVLEENTLERASRYLGANPVTDDVETDFLLELMVDDYGVAAHSWDGAAEFYIEAEATLLDGPSGTEIWRTRVSARDPIGPGVYGGPRGARDVVTAIVLATLDVDELVALLEGLADFSARVVTDRLRDDLRKARR